MSSAMFGVIVFGLRSGRLLAFVARALTIVVLVDLAPSSLAAAAVDKSVLAVINHAADVADERATEASAARRRTITDWRDLVSRSLSFHSNGEYKDAIQFAVEAEKVANLANDGPVRECATAAAFLQGVLLFEMGDYSLAESQLKRAIQSGEQDSAYRDEDRGTLFHRLAKVEYQQAQLSSAIAHIDHAVELRRKASRGSNSVTFLSLIERAQILIALGQLKQARSECDSIKQSVEDLRERDSIVFNRYLAVRGVLDAESGAYAEAIELLERSVKIEIEKAGPINPDLVTALLDLSEVQRTVGNLDAAKKSAQRASNSIEQRFGKNHPLYASAQRKLALVLISENDESAFDVAALAQEIQARVHPGANFGTAADFTLEGALYYRTALEVTIAAEDRVEYLHRAYSAQQEALTIYTGCGAKLYSAWIKCDLVKICRQRNDFPSADRLYNEALRDLFEIPTRHPKLRNVLRDGAIFFHNTQRYEPAVATLVVLKVLCKKDPVFNRDEYVDILINLGKCCGELGNLDAADEDLSEAIQLIRSAEEPMNRELAIALYFLGNVRKGQRKFNEAKAAIVESSELAEKLSGKHDELYAECMSSLGDIAFYTGEYNDAQNRYRQAAAIMNTVFGPYSDKQIPILRAQAATAEKAGDDEAAKAFLEKANAIAAASSTPKQQTTHQ